MSSDSDLIGHASSEFRVVPNNPETRFLSIAYSIPFVGMLIFVLVSFIAGVVGQQDALIMALVLVVVGGAVILNIQRNGRGSAVMASSGLVVKTRGSTNTYSWADVADVVLTSFAERGSWGRLVKRLTLWPERERFVELRLKRSLRQGLLPGRYGTRIKGIPLIGGDRIALYVDDPASFVRSAKTHLGASGGGTSLSSD
ncbi:MAG: hypothetical protein WD379_06480 [Dehalococcoidia bacterium]